ncbi:hypothetical protein DPX16_11023 [Anabarilius grahami]|uniref:Uncharacterized protein n=1 Tax=Anabarilius grahami TaxID=495550 RepID=A0A3N0Y9V5_ANAGA|nr:hypothetical protein DPX16_11023 [Anabarilius grahami]
MARRTDELRRRLNMSNQPKKGDEDQLKPTVWNTLRKRSQLTNKNCPTADRRLGPLYLTSPFTHTHKHITTMPMARMQVGCHRGRGAFVNTFPEQTSF